MRWILTVLFIVCLSLPTLAQDSLSIMKQAHLDNPSIKSTILMPKQTEKSVSQNYLLLPKSIQHLHIEPRYQYSFKEEAQSFRSFRKRYLSFWAIFFLMRATAW